MRTSSTWVSTSFLSLSGGATDDGDGQEQRECGGDAEHPEPDRVGVGAPVDVAHDQRRDEPSEPSRGADETGDAADPGWVGDLGAEGEGGATAGAEGGCHGEERDGADAAQGRGACRDGGAHD